MLQQRCKTGAARVCNPTPSDHRYVAFAVSDPTPEDDWKPFDLIRKRSGPQNLTRSGYGEEKCRNVLVRFCAHIPRNFQYKDGIQQIFLILREHLGDENLDLAGGVLYELIEVDCEHTDDPGAAFQRWRHDHMYRYADLELPHIPHMTTITSSIVPTEKLSRWRSEHADRYRFVLSDSSPISQREYADLSCIRNKKVWLIDHTLFVSTRSEGTRPMRSPNPKEFHEMQWDPDFGATGRLVDEREFPIASLDQSSDTSPPGSADTIESPSSRSQRLRHSLSSMSIIEKFVGKRNQKKAPDIERRRRSWIPNTFIFDSSSLHRDKRAQCGVVSVPWPDGYQIPNAIFARKFLIVDDGETLPSHLPISQMPTAESKATETIVEAANTGLLNQTSPWLFRGPFTPQLGFDGGLDYQWNLQDCALTPRYDPNCSSRNTELLGRNPRAKSQRLSSKRKGILVDLETGAEMKARAFKHGFLGYSASSKLIGERPQDHLPISFQYVSERSAASSSNGTDILRFTLERQDQYRPDTPLFDNIEFTAQTETHYNVCSPITNRQTTVIERPANGEAVRDTPTCRQGHPQCARSYVTSLAGSHASNNSRKTHINAQESPRELLLSKLQQEAHGFQEVAPSSRQVFHKATGEILRPLKYNSSRGGGVGREDSDFW
ncbi:hypothetical protein F5B22DRAFT_599619 [Xylaria bambusicola]|uniref:uncharacterized protein n=1 Tax=Xylaria bambusicola TaxID=326684 RepID=UPI002007AB94|nr:uncharacterized protein F5B22DRAFT_599619 [Xylaria bambusicola]KAI0518544.1 hypothetical protein F5B22DRAFT_599619 [Xylaria bambusicola]